MLPEFKFKVAAFCNFHSFSQRIRKILEPFPHCIGGFEIQLIRCKFEPALVIYCSAGLDTEKHFMGEGFIAVQVMAVIGGHKGNGKLPGELLQTLVNLFLFLYAVILEFKVESVAKYFFQSFCFLTGSIQVAVKDQVRYSPM